MVSTTQSYIYEDLDPKIETQNTQESHLLIVHIPDGFTKGDIGAKVEYDFGRVRVFGERSIGSNKKMRFDEKYQVPSHCDIGKIKGKFDGKTVTITMPNIPGKVPEQEQEQKPIEDDNAAKVSDQKDQQNTSHQDPKSSVESKEDATPQKDQVTKDDENPTSQEATKESIAQKGREEISKNESAPQKELEEISQKEPIPPPGREEISQKESIHENGRDQGTPNKASDTKDARLQTEETTSSLKYENKESQKFVKEETKEHLKKTMESEKPHVVNDSSPTLEEETKEESKESATLETFPPIKAFIEKGKEVINDKFGHDNDDEKKSEKKSFRESTRTRIKDMALSTSQAVTNYAKRFNEEDKQKLIYTGATILVVALGVYASYKYRSSRR